MPDRLPIIAHGESYIQAIARPNSGGPKERPHTYEEARTNILRDIDSVFTTIDEDPELYLDEKVLCVRMEPKFDAKSYTPSAMLRASEDMEIVGGRRYKLEPKEPDILTHEPTTDDESQPSEDDTEPQDAKLYFVRTTSQGIRNLQDTLRSGSNDGVAAWRNEIMSVRSFDLLEPGEKVQGFDESWESGPVEVVLHPFTSDRDQAVEMFCSIAGVELKDVEVRPYANGVTFIAVRLTKEAAQRVSRMNPLRTIHPLGRVNIEPMRKGFTAPAPQVQAGSTSPLVRVGVFDGGCNPTVPLLSGFVTAHDCVPSPTVQDYVDHGGAVCGAILHGELSGKSANDILPLPEVGVDCFRVLPTTDPNDFELYEAIDVIEQVVPNRPDISLYNISFGPTGPIFDDDISRFTYSLDTLTGDTDEDHEGPLFTIAVGNDGDMSEPFNRIQSPADLVNGLSVGAYSYDNVGERVRASYSCIGPGREGAKIKPDLLEFGGDFNKPFVVADMSGNLLTATAGTSFASPLVVHKLSEMLAQSEDVTPHMARMLMLHYADHDDSQPQGEYGFGISPGSAWNCLSCEENSVTSLYQGILRPTELVSLPIFAPSISDASGYVTVRWTIVAVCSVDPNDTDGYTASCIQDTFVPHEMKYLFRKDGVGSKTLDLSVPKNAVEAAALLNQGYKKSYLPMSASATPYWEESDLRANDFKWDTVISKHKRMRSSSLLQPSLTLQSIFRTNNNPDAIIRYYAAVTVDAPGYPGSLYTSTLQQYQSLAPIRLRIQNRLTNRGEI
uniref:S8 family peptidase n=1 Tax=Olsenella uli TaxID=133926 RepID=UPI0028F0ACED|nr:S8 family peptidase [Olsenella uli]